MPASLARDEHLACAVDIDGLAQGRVPEHFCPYSHNPACSDEHGSSWTRFALENIDDFRQSREEWRRGREMRSLGQGCPAMHAGTGPSYLTSHAREQEVALMLESAS